MSIFAEKKILEFTPELLKMFLPDVLVDHFTLTESVDKPKQEELHLYFEENNAPPEEHKGKILVSKGFHAPIIVQDFPLRGKEVYLHIKRRRWTDKDTNEIIQRDWTLVAKGSRWTVEFADFLKEISRYKST